MIVLCVILHYLANIILYCTKTRIYYIDSGGQEGSFQIKLWIGVYINVINKAKIKKNKPIV